MKTAVITGSSKGIGHALAASLLARDINVTVSSPDLAEAQDAATALASHAKQGAQTFATACDVTEPEQLDALGSAALDRFGRIDIWINNAGLALTGKPVLEISPVPLRRMLDINLVGALTGCQAAVRAMPEGGAIYNILGAGSDYVPVPRMAAYATTKAALTFLTRSLAAELEGSPWLIGGLSPGLVMTEGFMREHAKTPPEMLEAREKTVNVIGDHPETIGRWGARIVDTNTRHGRVFKWLTPAKICKRAAEQPPRDILARYRPITGEQS